LFSTDISELAHKAQIKESYRRSNKNNAATQILDNYSRVHAFEMHILNLYTALQKAPLDLMKDIKGNGIEQLLEVNSRHPATGSVTSPLPMRLLRSPEKGPKTVQDVLLVLGIPELAASIFRYAKDHRWTGPEDLPESLEDLCKHPAQRFKMLQVSVPIFQDPDSYVKHNLRCTGAESFHGMAARNDPVWVNVGEGITKTGDLGGRLPGFLWGLIRLKGGNKRLHRIAVVEVLWPVNGGNADPFDTLVRVQRRAYKSAIGGLWVTEIRSITGMAHLVPYGENRWLVNNRIDLKTWNDVYMGLGNTV